MTLHGAVTPEEFVDQLGVPSEIRPRAALALRDADISSVDQGNVKLAERLVREASGNVAARLAHEAAVLGGSIGRPGVRTAAAAPQCARCGAAMSGPVRIADDREVFVCSVDRVVKPVE